MPAFAAVVLGSLGSPGLPVTTQTASLEPGQADARTTQTAAVELPATWARPPREARGIWLTGTDLMAGREAVDQQLQSIANANFNTVMLDTWLRGYVLYPGSRLVPQLPAAVASGDPIKDAVERAHALGMRADAWPEYGFYAYHTMDAPSDPSRGPLLDKHPHLIARNADGGDFLHNATFGDYYSLCPANPESHLLLGQIIAESVAKYPFDGVNLDRLRFPTGEYCHCSWCKHTSQKDTGLPLARFDAGTSEALKWLEWKREQNAQGVTTIRKLIHEARPGLPITAYVVGPDEMNEKAQSWDLWVSRGLVEAVAVSMYGADIRPTMQRVLPLLGGRTDKLVCAISCDLPHTSLYLRNIAWGREAAALGQFTWHAGKVQDDLPGLVAGPYAAPALWPLDPNTNQGR